MKKQSLKGLLIFSFFSAKGTLVISTLTTGFTLKNMKKYERSSSIMNKQPLKGLLLFSLFSAKGHLVMASIIMLCFAIFALAVGTTPMTGFGAMLIFPTMSLLSDASEVKADKNKWDKFQLSMPIRCRDVMTSKYLFFLFLILLALIITGIVEGIAYLLDFLNILQVGRFAVGIDVIVEIIDVFAITTGQLSIGIILVSMGSAFLSCAIHYPLKFTIFKGMEELTALIVLLGNIAITAFFVWLFGRLELSLNQLILLSVLAPTLLLVLSYFFMIRIYQKLDV